MATLDQIQQLLRQQKEEIVAEITNNIQQQLQDVNTKLTAITEQTNENTTLLIMGRE